MEEDYTLPTIKTIDTSLRRFRVEKKKLNNRQGILSLYCAKMPDLSPALIASKMSHLSEAELQQNYHYIEKNARNFTAYWRWSFMPKKKA